MYRGKGFVEVHQFGVNKSTAMTLILRYMKDKVGVPDFAFFAGDDESDERAFKGKAFPSHTQLSFHRLIVPDLACTALLAFAENEPALEHVLTCTVGMKPSCAKFYVVRAALHGFASLSEPAFPHPSFCDALPGKSTG